MRSLPPAVTLAGLSDEMVGVGFTTANETAIDDPPPGEELEVTRLKEPTEARSAAVSATVSCVLLTYATAWDDPPIVRVVVGKNPVPVTVTVMGVARAPDEGLSDVIAGVGLLTVTVLAADAGPLDTDPFVTVKTS